MAKEFVSVPNKFGGKPIFTGKEGVIIPRGPTSKRGAPEQGKIRFNDETEGYEGGDGSSWVALGGGSGDGADPDLTYVTIDDESGSLPNSVRLEDVVAGGGGLFSGTTVRINATNDGPTYNVPEGVSQVLVDADNLEDPITIVLPPISSMAKGTVILIGVDPEYTNEPLVTVEANGADGGWGIYPNGDYTLGSPAFYNYSTFAFLANPDTDAFGYQWMLMPDSSFLPNDLYLDPAASIFFWPQGSDTDSNPYRLRASDEVLSGGDGGTRSIFLKNPGIGSTQLGLVDTAGGISGQVPVWNAGPGEGGYFSLQDSSDSGAAVAPSGSGKILGYPQHGLSPIRDDSYQIGEAAVVDAKGNFWTVVQSGTDSELYLYPPSWFELTMIDPGGEEFNLPDAFLVTTLTDCIANGLVIGADGELYVNSEYDTVGGVFKVKISDGSFDVTHMEPLETEPNQVDIVSSGDAVWVSAFTSSPDEGYIAKYTNAGVATHYQTTNPRPGSLTVLGDNVWFGTWLGDTEGGPPVLDGYGVIDADGDITEYLIAVANNGSRGFIVSDGFDDGYLYVAFQADGDGTYTEDHVYVLKIDPADGSILDTIDLNDGTNGFPLSMLAGRDGLLYLILSQDTYYILKPDLTTYQTGALDNLSSTPYKLFHGVDGSPHYPTGSEFYKFSSLEITGQRYFTGQPQKINGNLSGQVWVTYPDAGPGFRKVLLRFSSFQCSTEQEINLGNFNEGCGIVGNTTGIAFDDPEWGGYYNNKLVVPPTDAAFDGWVTIEGR